MSEEIALKSDTTGFVSTSLGIVFQPWIERGIQHLFGTKELSLENAPVRPYLLSQVHGRTVVLAEKPPAGTPEGDGWIVPRTAARGAPQAYALRTADCLPILVASPRAVALIHAGWRGLAAGILAEALRLLPDANEGIEVVIGPAAGPTRYEVGREVVRGIGECAVVQNTGGDTFLLNLAETAARQIRRAAPGAAELFIAPHCTMSDPRFHSHRRDGAKAGRNLTVFFQTEPLP